MKETNIGKLTLSVGITVDYSTADMCLRLLEIYLNNNEAETLHINCDEYGNWDLDIVSREIDKGR